MRTMRRRCGAAACKTALPAQATCSFILPTSLLAATPSLSCCCVGSALVCVTGGLIGERDLKGKGKGNIPSQLKGAKQTYKGGARRANVSLHKASQISMTICTSITLLMTL